jgi:TonB family protein
MFLAVLYCFYWIGLRMDTFFSLNRFYLLVSVFVSFLVPLISLNIRITRPITPMLNYMQKVTISPIEITRVINQDFAWNEITAWLYTAGVCFYLIQFLVRILKFSRFVSKNRVIRKEGLKLVVTNSRYAPFSFFSFVFINKELYNNQDISTILAHEKIHATQFHSVDLLIIEVFKIFQWFNPFIWFLGRSLKNTHEFIADSRVIIGGFQMNAYQELLFTQATGIKFSSLANNFNHSPLKKRLIMITKRRSTAFSKTKTIMAIPLIFAMLYIFADGTGNILRAQEKQKNQTNPQTTKNTVKDTLKGAVEDTTLISRRDQYNELESYPQFPGGNEKSLQFLNENIKYPDEAKKAKIEGEVIISFIVEKDGRLSNLKILRGLGGGCDEELIRVVKLMPLWNPGIAHGKPVRVAIALPVTFSLGNKKPGSK